MSLFKPFGFYQTKKKEGITYNIPQTGNLIHYYKMDEGSGTTINDIGSSAVNGTLSTSGAWTTSGYINNGLNWGSVGRGEEITINNSAATFSSDNSTFSIWVYPTNNTLDSYIISGRSSTGSYNLWTLIWYPTNPGYNGLAIAMGGGSGWATTNTVETINQWYHVVGTNNGTTTKFYINGALSDTISTGVNATINLILLANARADLSLGFPGIIDEFGVWDVELSAAEVLELYNAQSIDKKQPS